MTSRDISRRTLIAAAAALPIGAAVTALSATTGLAASATQPPDLPEGKKRVSVLDSHMTYVDRGEGLPVLFLHGNPASSYLWRNILPKLAGSYRTIAPDLIGMGDSGPSSGDYSFMDQAGYLDAFIESLSVDRFVLVAQDWGAALGMRYARLNPKRVVGLAFWEAVAPPAIPVPSFDAMPEDQAAFFKMVRSPQGEEAILEQNVFIEMILPKMGVMRALSLDEMEQYRRPFPTPESRRPILAWAREIPVAGDPAETARELVANGDWLQGSQIPKLLFFAEPGSLTPKPVVDFLAANTANLESQSLGHGLHFLEEDHPDLIASGLADWLERNY